MTERDCIEAKDHGQSGQQYRKQATGKLCHAASQLNPAAKTEHHKAGRQAKQSIRPRPSIGSHSQGDV
jgi:hypothetical protein